MMELSAKAYKKLFHSAVVNRSMKEVLQNLKDSSIKSVSDRETIKSAVVHIMELSGYLFMKF